MSNEPSRLLDNAHSLITNLLDHLRTLVETARQHDAEITQQMRQAARSLDEVVMQRQFATERNMPNVEALVERERQLRASYTGLKQQSQQAQRSLKQLDQLMRQIDMSSGTLGGSEDNEPDDPWMLALRSQIVLGREEERLRLAREVHDGPAQVLANTLMVSEQCRSLLQDERIDQLGLMLDRLCDATREGLHEVRRFIADLRPGRIEEQGLTAVLQEYIRRYQDTYGVRASFEADVVSRMSIETEIVIYRIFQEALQNAHKHAPGASISVLLTERHNHIMLIIRDDGPGFDPREVARRAGRESWGLTSMRERAELIGAKLVVSSRPGHGTEVSFALPLARAQTA
jgi:two-component system sensor histidine kinase DegS